MVERVEIITDKLGNWIIRGEGLSGTKSAERAHKRELSKGRTKIWEGVYGRLLPGWLIRFVLQF
jgi:hypothetical protein